MEFHGEDGQPLSMSLDGVLGLKWLQTIRVKGEVRKDSRGNVSIVATHFALTED